MPQSKEAHAAYVRQKRQAAKAVTPDIANVDPQPGEGPRERCTFQHSYKPIWVDGSPSANVECRSCGIVVPKGTPTYVDGLPDWDELIASVPTKDQQRLLEKTNRVGTTPGRH